MQALVAVAGASGASSIASGFSLLTTLGSSFMQASSGVSESNALKMQAEQSAINARLEKVNAEEKANDIRRRLKENLGSVNAIFAARGIGIGSGTPEQARVESSKNAANSIDKARFGGDMASNERLLQAQQYKKDASAAKLSGFGRAAKSLGSLVDL